MRKLLLNHTPLFRKLRQLSLLLTLLLALPQTAMGATEVVTKTITFNKTVSTVSSSINNSTMSVSVNEQITGGASTTYDGFVKIWDAYSLLNSYSCSTGGGAVFNVKSTATNDKIFTIEIPGNYPKVPTQVTLTVSYNNSVTGTNGENAKIQVGDYGNGDKASTPPEGTDPVPFYHYYHPYRSNEASMSETTLTYTASNTSGLGTNRDDPGSLCIFVYLNGNDAAQTTFTIKEATITYNREAYGPVVAGIHVGDDNKSNVLNDDYSSVSYDSDSKTLTLKGVHLSSTNNGISVPSDLNINLVGYSDVGTITVGSGTLNFTTSTTLPGCLKTNVAGTSTITYGDGTGLSWNGTMVKSSSTNPIECYVTGYKANGDNYTISESSGDYDISSLSSLSSTVIHLHASNATVDQNNRYIKVSPASSTVHEAYLCLSDLTQMYPLTKIYLQYEGVKCANNNTVSVRAMGFTSSSSYDNNVTYSDPVDLGNGGIVEIPLTSEVTDGLVGLVFTSSSDFSFIPINVGFQKKTIQEYDLYIDGTQVTTENASDILTGTNAEKVSYNAADNILTLNGASLSKIRTELSGLKINLIGTNTIVASDSAAIQRAIPENNDNGTAITLSFNGTGNLTITKKTITDNYYYPSINNHITVSYNDGLVSEESNSTTRISKGYNLTIAGTTVTELNSPDIFFFSKVSFTPASSGNNNTNTRTLHGASFNNPIISNLDNLTILIQGDNDLANNQSGASGYISSTNTNAPLTLKGGTGDCKLRLDDNYGNAVISGFASVTFDGVYLSTSRAAKYVPGTGAAIKDLDGGIVQLATITTTHYYPLWVNSIQVYEGIIDDIYKDGENSDPIRATFAPASNTLTLNGVSIDSSNGIESGLNSLTINLKGNNSINTNTAAYYSPICSMEAVPLTIQKATDATNCELRLGSAFDVPQVVKGFSSVSHPSLNFVSKTGSTIADAATKDALLSSSAIYPLWVAGTMVTESASSGTGWSYDGNTNTLTLDGYTSTFDGHAFAINMPNLNVYLKGTNTVGYANIIGYQAFYSYYTDATLTFSTDENNMGKLDASYYATFCDGFKVDNNIHCIYCNNGLGYYPSDRKIEAKKTPTIKFVTRDQTDGSIPANQSDYVYVPDNGIQIPYAASYYAPKPVFSDDYLLSDSTRYEYTMSVDGVVEFVLSSTPSGNLGKIDYANDGKVNILKSGELTITCTFPGNLQNEPCSASYTLKITRVFNNPFATTPAEQIYATYYNFNEDLALPDGIVAYIVTGISGNTVTTTATGYLPQNTAVLLEKTGDVGPTVTVTGYTGSAGDFTGNLLRYIVSADPSSQTPGVPTTGKEYVLYKNEFVRATNTIPTNSCYLDLNGVSFTRGAYGIGDGSTAIKALQLDAIENETWFDLQGRRIDKPTRPGLYIKNGKKVVVNNK